LRGARSRERSRAQYLGELRAQYVGEPRAQYVGMERPIPGRSRAGTCETRCYTSALVSRKDTTSLASARPRGDLRPRADEPDFIVVRGAREHNLAIDELRIPKRSL